MKRKLLELILVISIISLLLVIVFKNILDLNKKVQNTIEEINIHRSLF